MQSGVCYFEEVQEGLNFEEVVGLYAEGVLLEETVCAQQGRGRGVLSFHALVLVQGK